MAHVPGNGSIDFFISGRFYYDGDVFGLRKQGIGAVSCDPGVFLDKSVNELDILLLEAYPKLFDVYALLGIFLKQTPEQILEVFVAVAVKFDLIHPNRLIQFDHAMLLERYPAESQTVQRTAHGPYISSSARNVPMFCNAEFRRHESW